MKLRGILPTFVTDQQVVLCKAAPAIRNAYEIRLALFMAVQSGRAFVLAVSPMAFVDQTLESHIREHGGQIVREAIRDHSVYVGAVDSAGAEGDGWVAGDGQAWASVVDALKSPWLRDRLRVSGSVSTSELPQFRDLVRAEAIRACNVDDEEIQQALLRLAAEAKEIGGSLFVQ
jgi:hypothetical protein